MGKSKKKNKDKKKQRRAERNHAAHHQALHEWVTDQIPSDQHVMPMAQPWHVPKVECFCVPVREQDQVTGLTVWIHRAIVH